MIDDLNKPQVIVLHGFSGTGKGTTVAELQQKLPNTLTWSNGNLFRSMTLLAGAKCKELGVPLTEDALTPELLSEVSGMLKFSKVCRQGHFYPSCPVNRILDCNNENKHIFVSVLSFLEIAFSLETSLTPRLLDSGMTHSSVKLN
jgi:cytidylate kinase